MRVFNCDACGHLVFFESLQCVHCGAALAFLPDSLRMASVRLESAPEPSPPHGWHSARPAPQGTGADSGQPLRYRLCAHRHDISLCNFAIAEDDSQDLCLSCRQTLWLPDASNPANQMRWAKIEAAKRLLFYTSAKLGLMRTDGKADPEQHPRFSLLADMPDAAPVLTGHAHGMITLNVVEADDEERVRRRLALHEPYRTLIGHLRHESGHFYWDRLIAGSHWLEPFRALFGDERQDYAQALKVHYGKDPLTLHWQEDYISAYATAHPWEDWAETWAHYLHMVDLLETAASYDTHIRLPDGMSQPVGMRDPFARPGPDFDTMLAQWVPLTLLLNSMTRSLGHVDAYPFTISPGARRKLRFVHDVVRERADSMAL